MHQDFFNASAPFPFTLDSSHGTKFCMQGQKRGTVVATPPQIRSATVSFVCRALFGCALQEQGASWVAMALRERVLQAADLLEVPNGDTAKDWPGLPAEYLEPCLLRFAAVYKLSKREDERDRVDRAMKAALELILRTGLRHPILFLGSHTPAYCWSQH